MSSGWKSIDVKIVGDEGVAKNDLPQNHYDDRKLSKVAKRDLPVAPGEDVGIFLGLEVLGADDYQLVNEGGSKRLIVKSKEGKSKEEKASKEPSRKKRKAEEQLTKKQEESDKGDEKIATKKKKKKKKKKSATPELPPRNSSSDAGTSQCDTESVDSRPLHERSDEVDAEELLKIQQSWSKASNGAILHDKLLKALHAANFVNPTPIQAQTLAAATMGRRNLVGAAPTGSGKTLAFLLPIVQHILHNDTKAIVEALIITPTRELATQILQECEKLYPQQCVGLVGGIALVKQKRLLEQRKPPIIIGTPGRIWAMISSGENEHLNDLSRIKFLVLDEADRMTQDHCYPQLVRILDAVNDANPREENDGESDEDDSDDEGSETRLLGLPGVRGEAKLTMLTDDILNQVKDQRVMERPEAKEVQDYDLKSVEVDDDDEFWEAPKVHRQTFVFSATLLAPRTLTKAKVSSKKKKKDKDHAGGISDLLEKTHAMGETKVVDLSTSSNVTQSSVSGGVRLPNGLRLEVIKCTQRHKDSHLYAYLMITQQGSSGPCLVFCNSIAAVRRVGSTLRTLGMPVRILHAHMQQRARYKAVESLANSNSRAIVVCTDVAARGLDIESVSTVVHYDIPRTVDTFVHRSGRTARGVGDKAVGSSLSLVASAEDTAHSKIASALQVPFEKVFLDGRLMTSAQERTNLASKVWLASELQQKTESRNKWFLDKAKEADLEIDDDMLDTDRSQKEITQLREAEKAKIQLARLLKEPMKTQRYGKYLSTNSAVAAANTVQPIYAEIKNI